MDVDAIEQRARDPPAVSLERSAIAATLPPRVTEVSAQTPLRCVFAMSPCEDENRSRLPIRPRSVPSGTTCAGGGSTPSSASGTWPSSSSPTLAPSPTGNRPDEPGTQVHPAARRLPRLPAPPHRRDPGRTTGGLSDGPRPVPEGNRPAPRHRPGDAEPVGTRAPGSGRSVCPAARCLPGTARRRSAQSPRFVARPRLTVVASWTYWSRPPWPVKRPDAATPNWELQNQSGFPFWSRRMGKRMRIIPGRHASRQAVCALANPNHASLPEVLRNERDDPTAHSIVLGLDDRIRAGERFLRR